MSNTEKRIIKRRFDLNCFPGNSVDTWLACIERACGYAKREGVENLTLEDDSPGEDYYLSGTRRETDEEQRDREEREALTAARHAERAAQKLAQQNHNALIKLLRDKTPEEVQRLLALAKTP
ncbi:MAG: hypothetical protein WC505_06060 [Patescibacteria group bacterium]